MASGGSLAGLAMAPGFLASVAFRASSDADPQTVTSAIDEQY
jgi:hypothetical protein